MIMAQTLPTSGQNGLGLAIGQLVVEAMQNGASYDEVIATLDHCANLARLNQAMQADFASPARRVPQGTFRHRHHATHIGE